MEDLQQTLNRVLSDPEQMAQLRAMAESLGLTDAAPKEPAGPQAAAGSDRTPGEGGSPGSGFPGPDAEMLRRLIGSVSSLSGSEEGVLRALRPTLGPDKQGKIDRALQAARISRLAGQFLRGFGKEGQHV